MAKTTRIATTVTARYGPVSGAADGFWLDGRMSGRRESRAADMTLDREERGFFFSLFAYPPTGTSLEADQSAVRQTLDRFQQGMAHTGRNIDSEINDLAQCAVDVTGRISLQQEGIRQPYFAGIVVKDGEMAAVTMGRGCAYLYRDDALYPLTSDDVPLEAIDGRGDPVQDLEIYCAGTAGTVRYSNIAQLKVDDCLILCNREVMDAIGQREMLRLLEEAQDQAEAAGMVMTSAAAKSPGVPLQFLIGYVEAIAASDRGRAILSRSRPSPSAPAAPSVPVASPAGSHKAPGPSIPPPASAGRSTREAAAGTAAGTMSGPSAGAAGTAAGVPHTGSSRIGPARTGTPRADVAADTGEGGLPSQGMYLEDEPRSGTARMIAIVALAILVIAGCLYALYTMLFVPGVLPGTPTPTTAPTATVTEGEEPTAVVSAEPTQDPLLTPTAAPTVTPGGLPTTHRVKSGDTLSGICQTYYKSEDSMYIQMIIDANKEKYPSIDTDFIQLDWELVIPAKP